MGCVSSTVIGDISREKFLRLMQEEAVHEDCQLIVAVDGTSSNDLRRSGGSVNYHALSEQKNVKNPYELTLELSSLLLSQSKDSDIPLYIFGTSEANRSRETPGVYNAGTVHIHNGDPTPLVNLYRDTIRGQTLSGPTDFRPLLDIAIAHVDRTKQFTVLVIITDGVLTRGRLDHVAKLRLASNYPLSVVAIGVGNARFDEMQHLDDCTGRRVDNFQFTALRDVCSLERMRAMRNELFYRAFMEVPLQYRAFRRVLGYEPPMNVREERAEPGEYLVSASAPPECEGGEHM